MLGRGLLAFGVVFSGTWCDVALALQPLRAFVESSKQNNPDNQEARAAVERRSAEREAAAAPYLPSFTAQGVYTRNQHHASFTLPDGQSVTLLPANGLDAYFTLQVPLVNIGAWKQRAAATALQKVAEASRRGTELAVESSVTQAYFQLLGSEAVLLAAQQSLEVAEQNAKLVFTRRDLGTASDLDAQRADADVARARGDLAQADQGVVLSRRVLESLSRLSPEPATPANYDEDSLREEAPLEAWLGRGRQQLVSVRPAVLAVEAAKEGHAAAKASWAPTLSAQAQEHLTNASGFTGHTATYTLMATLQWRFDFGLSSNVAAQAAEVVAARARQDRAERDAEDAIYRAWQQVRVGIEKARAARAQVIAARLAQNLARDRYANGVATQLEVVQAQRDYFSAAVAQVQADFDLHLARALLRVASRRTATEEGSR